MRVTEIITRELNWQQFYLYFYNILVINFSNGIFYVSPLGGSYPRMTRGTIKC